MTLDNIQLTGYLINDLYSKSLVDLEKPKENSTVAHKTEWAFLGKNEKNILLLINEREAAFLPDESLHFLLGILAACKLTMADVAIVNYFTNQGMDYTNLAENFSPDKIIFFGLEPAKLNFPLHFPNYQLQKYNGQTYLSAPSLAILAKDISQKKQLWSCLKNLFAI